MRVHVCRYYKILDKQKSVKCEEMCLNNQPPKDCEVILFITIINKITFYSLGDQLFTYAFLRLALFLFIYIIIIIFK